MNEAGSKSEGTATHPQFRFAAVVVLSVVIVLLAVIRWRLREMPLERDEGEYAYAGQLILQGVPPYQIAYNMKLPGTYAAYAVIMGIFGQTAAGIRLGLLVANAFTIVLVFVLGKRLYGTLAGVVAGASYGLLSIEPWINGFAGHATHFVVLAATAGLWLLLEAIDEQRDWMIFCAGLLLGLAFVMKQPGAAYGLFAALYLIKASWTAGRARTTIRLAWLTAGWIVPFAVTCLVLWRAGVFAKFWFWTFSYAYEYGTSVGLADGCKYFVKNFGKLVLSAIGLWLVAAVGLTAFFWSSKARAHADFLLGLLFFSGLAVSAGFYFRRHYFILLLPAVSLLAGLAVSSVADWARQSNSRPAPRYIPAVVFFAAFVASLFQQGYFFFQADPISASRYVYPYDPFPEAAEVGRYIEQHSSPADRIAVLGSEPQIMFYSRRRSVTGYLYAYPLVEHQKYAATMQQEAISEIEAAHPEYLVFVKDWAGDPDKALKRQIFDWADRYITQNYEMIGVMRLDDDLQFHSQSEIARAPGNLFGASFLYRRKSSGRR